MTINKSFWNDVFCFQGAEEPPEPELLGKVTGGPGFVVLNSDQVNIKYNSEKNQFELESQYY